jgi:ATP-dependent Clp protease ATP-binding subunit ClpA
LFSRLSASSQRVLRAAEQECRNRNQYYVGVEHVLLALLEDDDPELEAQLCDRGLSRREIHRELRRGLGVGEERTWEGILITPRARHAFEEAGRAAAGGEVRPAHLFLAIVGQGGIVSEYVTARVTPASLSG